MKVNETPLAQIKENKMDKQFIGICAPVVLLLLALAKNATNSATSEDDTIAKHKKLLGLIFGIILILNFLFSEWVVFLPLTLAIVFIGKLQFHFISFIDKQKILLIIAYFLFPIFISTAYLFYLWK